MPHASSVPTQSSTSSLPSASASAAHHHHTRPRRQLVAVTIAVASWDAVTTAHTTFVILEAGTVVGGGFRVEVACAGIIAARHLHKGATFKRSCTVKFNADLLLVNPYTKREDLEVHLARDVARCGDLHDQDLQVGIRQTVRCRVQHVPRCACEGGAFQDWSHLASKSNGVICWLAVLHNRRIGSTRNA